MSFENSDLHSSITQNLSATPENSAPLINNNIVLLPLIIWRYFENILQVISVKTLLFNHCVSDMIYS
jgi:hypothetical protein